MTATAAAAGAGAAARFVLPVLRYGYDGLEPALSEGALRTHHGEHHARCIDATNRLLGQAGAAVRSLEDLLNDGGDGALCESAARTWNHGFFWQSMNRFIVGPEGLLAGAVTTDFGNFDTLRSRFLAEGARHCGPGWIWLVANGPHIAITTTDDAHSIAATAGVTPLLVCDLSDHAYRADHKDQGAWLASWWDRLANWNFAERQYGVALGHGEAWHHPLAVGA